MAAPVGHLTIKFNSIKFNSLGLLVKVYQKCFRIITVYQCEKCSQIQIMELIHLNKKHVNI